MSIAMASILWALLIVKSVSYRRCQDPCLLLCVLAVAISFTADVDLFSASFDRTWDEGNYLNLVSSLFFSTGVYLFCASVIKAVRPAKSHLFDVTARIALLAVLITQVVSFLLIDSAGWEPSLALAYGDQMATVAYFLVEDGYTTAVLAPTGFICLFYRRWFRTWRFRLGLLLTGIGCAIAMVAELLAIAYLIAGFNGNTGAQEIIGAFHKPAFVLAVITLATGLALPGAVNTIERHRRRIRARRLARQLEPVWAHATHSRRHMRIPVGAETPRLYRMIIETRDALIHTPELNDELDDEAWRALTASENFWTRHK